MYADTIRGGYRVGGRPRTGRDCYETKGDSQLSHARLPSRGGLCLLKFTTLARFTVVLRTGKAFGGNSKVAISSLSLSHLHRHQPQKCKHCKPASQESSPPPSQTHNARVDVGYLPGSSQHTTRVKHLAYTAVRARILLRQCRALISAHGEGHRIPLLVGK